MDAFAKAIFFKNMDNYGNMSYGEKRQQRTVKGLTYIFVKMLAEPQFHLM
jgi:hypothetical protein